MTREHPWRRLRALSDWLIAWSYLPGSLWGMTDHDAKIIVLDSRLTQAQRRCTLAHELEHVERGPVPSDVVLAAREELAVDMAVARKLVPLDDLGEALAWSRQPAEIAEELWVDTSTLRTRAEHLGDDERALIDARLADIYLP